MNVLVTSARFFFHVELVRKLGAAGHEVYACDSYRVAPGLHSHYLKKHFITPCPATETAEFVAEIDRHAGECQVDLIVPAYEEVFYLAHERERLSKPLWAAPFDSLATLHGKASFVELCERLGLRVPRTIIARDRDQLEAATQELGDFFARPAFSRAGIFLYTNSGPRAGRMKLSDCDPTDRSPWLVQSFQEGTDACSYSVCHEGRVLAHTTYTIPVEWNDATGVQFHSIDAASTIPIVERIAAATSFTGHLSFDWKLSGDEPCLIECNPRGTSGISLMPEETLAAAVCEPESLSEVQLVPAGRSMQLDLGIVNEVFVRRLPPLEGLRDLLEVRDIYLEKMDIVPALYGLLSLGHDIRSAAIAQKHHENAAVAIGHDIDWNGQEISP